MAMDKRPVRVLSVAARQTSLQQTDSLLSCKAQFRHLQAHRDRLGFV